MADWIFAVIDKLGSVGVGLLILLENLVPPIPSEVILPLAGFRARSGALHPVGVWVAATVGALGGALILYGVGRVLGYQRLHNLAGKRWFILTSAKDLERGRALFQRHGSWVVAAARCVPVMRSLVSLPAGIVGMPLLRFCLLTLLGSGLWNAGFVAAGWALADRWQEVERYSGPVGVVVGTLLIAALIWLGWRRHREGPE